MHLKTTSSILVDSRRQAANMAMLKVFPKRRGVLPQQTRTVSCCEGPGGREKKTAYLMSTSEGQVSHWCCCMISGLLEPQSSL